MSISIARIGRPHGTRGEVTLVTEHAALFTPGAEFDTDRGTTLRVRSARPYRDRGLVVGFDGVEDRDSAEGLRSTVLTVSERPALEPGEWWTSDLVGLRAVSADGAALGEVVDVVTGGAQDRLVVATPAGEQVEVPFVSEMADDPEAGMIVLRPPEGLFPPPG